MKTGDSTIKVVTEQGQAEVAATRHTTIVSIEEDTTMVKLEIYIPAKCSAYDPDAPATHASAILTLEETSYFAGNLLKLIEGYRTYG